MAGFGGGGRVGHGRGPRLIGFLCDWNRQKACGFLDCEGRRLFVHKSEFAQPFADGQEPPVGTRLSFVHGHDPKSGKERACDVWIEQPMPHGGPPGGAMGHMAAGGRGPRLFGVLREWDPRKACGFLDCEGRRLFVHKTEFVHPFQDGQEPPPGTELSFVHGVDAKSGKERACEIVVEPAMGSRGHAPGHHAFGYGYGGPSPAYGGPGPGYGGMPYHGGTPYGNGMPPAGYGQFGGGPGPGYSAARALAAQQRLRGKLVEWNSQKACGFVECVDPPGKRLFAHKTEFAVPFVDGEEPPLGTILSFMFGNDPKSGKQRAVDIRPGDGPMAMEMQHHSFAAGGPAGYGKRDFGGARRRLTGTVEEWKMDRACGFIQARELPGKKFFAHKSEFAVPFAEGEEEFLMGTEVNFVVGNDPRSGKERAQDIRLGVDMEDGSGAPRLYGTLKEWNGQKACGFIECERPGKSGTAKLFAHKSEFAEPFEDGGEPALGTGLSFVLGHDAKSGRERAVDIRIAGPDDEPPSKRPRFGA